MLKSEAEVMQAAESRDRLNKNNVDIYIGAAEIQQSPSDDEESGTTIVRVCRPNGCVEIETKNLVIATGSRLLTNESPKLS